MQDVMMLSSEEVAMQAEKLYEERIRREVEQPENVGKMVIIDIGTGDYAIDQTGLQAVRHLRQKNSHGAFFGIRIGYNVAASIGGVMERTEA